MAQGGMDGEFNFVEAFKALTGYAPMPWQEALYRQFLTGDFSRPLCLPTGLGKTTVIHIWLLALANAPTGVPRRLVYVVNRRTIVDQATREAERLRQNLSKTPSVMTRLRALCGAELPLAISTLRGQFADNGEWCADPARPAIIVGTVDMIGSRLLFNGYRTGSWQLARHAGLIGQDSLILHDEAHLEPAFQRLVDWIRERQEGDGSPRSLRVVAMTATAQGEEACRPFILTNHDLQHPVVTDRLNAVKHLCLHPHDPKTRGLADQLVDLAWQHIDKKARVIVYVRSPECAGKVHKALLERLDKAGRESRTNVALLTGTVRGYEREGLLEHPAVHGLLHANDQEGRRLIPEHTTYLVATSAGEVGADFDADHLVCDLTTADAMIQRLGRVNRRGGAGRIAHIDMVLDRPQSSKAKDGSEKKLSPLDQARIATVDLLERLPEIPQEAAEASPGHTRRHASPGALRELVERYPEVYATAASPKPAVITPHDVVLDAWALTSIQEDWPLAQDVHPYLHGLDDPMPETSVLWRAEVDELPSGNSADAQAVKEIMRSILRHCPPGPLELLREKPQHIAELLLELSKDERCCQTWVIRIRHRSVSDPQRLGDLVKSASNSAQLASELRYETVILATSVGGLDATGMLQVPSTKSTSITPVRDLGELAPAADGKEEVAVRRRVLVTRGDDGHWRTKMLVPLRAGSGEGDDEMGETFPKWTDARDHAAQRLNMRYVSRTVMEEDDDGASRILLFFRERAAATPRGDEQRVTVVKHAKAVQGIAERIAQCLKLDDPALLSALTTAGGGHDLGKADLRWQTAIRNDDLSRPLAKSFGNGFYPKELNGYRHEFGSLRALIEQLPDNDARDLTLHLIAAHHGRGRPHFELRATADPAGLPGDLPQQLRPAETACRFARLQRKFGHWGLAWLESILMAADGEGSALATMATDELEEEEV